MKQLKYVLGLDLGVASIGWSVVELNKEDDPVRIVDVGATIFPSLINSEKLPNIVRREKRHSRRNLRRKKERLRRAQKLLKEHNLINNAVDIYDKPSTEIIYYTKVRGLTEKLDKDELARCLLHYIKNRGFKSNRKEELDENDKEGKKILDSIRNLEEIMNSEDPKLYVSQAIIKKREKEKSAAFTNKYGEYHYFYKRNHIVEEVKALLITQEKFGLINKSFIDDFLEILQSQRDFSEGPGFSSLNEPSPYGFNDFQDFFGECRYTKSLVEKNGLEGVCTKRIAKDTPTYEIFVFLEKLINFRYINLEDENTPLNLTENQIKKIYNNVIDENSNLLEKKITVKFIFDKLGIDKEKNILKPNLNNHHLNRKEKNDYVIYQFSVYPLLKEKFQDASIETMDAIGLLLSCAKTDEKIIKLLENDERFKEIPKKYKDGIIQLNLENKFGGSGKLSMYLVKAINKKFLQGKDYYQALTELEIVDIEPNYEKFPTIREIENSIGYDITSPNIRRILILLRKLYKQIEINYGVPTLVRIELARELVKSKKVRKEITKKQADKAKTNANILKILSQSFNRNIKYFTNDDIIRYKLYEEQNGICLYTGEKIELKSLLSNAYDVDHIIPYSICFDDSFENKVITTSKSNKDKNNRIPYNWLSKEDFTNMSKRLPKNISKRKKERLLAKSISPEYIRNALNLQLTGHITVLVKNVFVGLLGQDAVEVVHGGHTALMRRFFQLNKYASSLVSSDYIKFNAKKMIFKYFEPNEKKEKDSLKLNLKNDFGEKISYSFDLKSKNYDIPLINAFMKKLFVNKSMNENNLGDEDEKFVDVLNLEFKKLNELFEEITKDETDENKNMLFDFLGELNKAIYLLKAEKNKKDRNYHLHHAVDATLIAICNKKMICDLNNFNLFKQLEKQKTKRINHPDKIIDFETGEEITYTEFIEKCKKEFVDRHDDFKPPYKEFINELVFRVFERDENTLKRNLRKLNNYKGVDMNRIKVKFPYHALRHKETGQLFEDTPLRNDTKTVRKRVEKLLSVDIENIVDPKVKEAIVSWFSLGKKERDKNLPTIFHPKERRFIRKVTIKTNKEQNNETESRIKITRKNDTSYYSTSTVVLVEIYRKKEEQNFSAAAIDMLNYQKYKKEDYSFSVKLYTKGKNFENYIHKDLEQHGYELIASCNKDDVVELGYENTVHRLLITGFTGGVIEFSSILGDNIDFDKEKYVERPRVSVGKIQSIKKVQIDLLGNLIV